MADLFSEWQTHLRTIAVANKNYAIDHLNQFNTHHLVQTIKKQINQTFTVRKTAAAAVLVVMTALGAAGIQHTVGKTELYYKVYVDGKYVGVVKNPNLVYDKIASLTEKFEASVALVPVHQRFEKGASEGDISQAIADAVNPKVTAVMIRVDGQDAVAVEDMTAAQAVIEAIKAKFASADNSVKEVKIMQKVDFLTMRVNRDEVRSRESAVSVLLEGKEKPKKYLVSRGDSLWTIAARNQVTVEKLKAANPQITNENVLQEGEQISINSVEPLVSVETVEEISRTVPYEFETVYREDASLNKGEERVITEGQAGEKFQRVQVRKKNGKVYAEVVLSEQVTREKVDKVVVRGTKVPTEASGDWVWPTASRNLSSAYGERRGGSRHLAVDISAPTGTPVYASNNGRVIYAGWDGGYGNVIRISHGKGVVSVYGHLSSIGVSAGQQVSKGDVIGRVGSTGDSTGPHLHYEVRVNGVAVNPAPYM